MWHAISSIVDMLGSLQIQNASLVLKLLVSNYFWSLFWIYRHNISEIRSKRNVQGLHAMYMYFVRFIYKNVYFNPEKLHDFDFNLLRNKFTFQSTTLKQWESHIQVNVGTLSWMSLFYQDSTAFFNLIFLFLAVCRQYRPPLRGVSSLQKEVCCCVCQGSSQGLVQLDINENWTVRMLR